MLNVYDQLTRVAPGSQDVEPGLAESWETSEDGLTWTFNLREAKLPDGTPADRRATSSFPLERTFESPSQWAISSPHSTPSPLMMIER